MPTSARTFRPPHRRLWETRAANGRPYGRYDVGTAGRGTRPLRAGYGVASNARRYGRACCLFPVPRSLFPTAQALFLHHGFFAQEGAELGEHDGFGGTGGAPAEAGIGEVEDRGHGAGEHIQDGPGF